jgi:hypothetical protein
MIVKHLGIVFLFESIDLMTSEVKEVFLKGG